MARRGALGGFSLDLFGGGGVDASVFNVASTAAQSKSNEAYLALTRVETQWEAGQTDNGTYLAALGTYANSFKPDTSEYLNQQARLAATTDRIERNVLVASVNAGNASLTDLLNYDMGKLSGINPDSQEYLDRLSAVSTTQNQLLADEERDVTRVYSDGKMTTLQLQAWYKERANDPRFGGNPLLAEEIFGRIKELDGRIVDERDSQMAADYSAGKISPTAFLLYAEEARARYAEGTTEARNWDRRIEQAGDAAVEDDLNYRYSLSQDYARLQQFVASNKPPTSQKVTSTSKGTTSTRTILGADGKWKTVKTTSGGGTSTKVVGPSKAELAAWAKRKVEVDAAKQQMASIASKLSGLPGGFVDNTDMLGYYQKQLGTVASGSSEWYSLQSKIDTINSNIASQKVLAKQGIKISYPSVKSEKSEGYTTSSASQTTGGGTAKPAAKKSNNVSLDAFIAAIAKTESGGRYDARNKTTGAYGKYQILPSNWSSYAQKAGLPANAKPTPENQEKVARAAFERYYDKYDGDYAKMAAAWHAGVAGTSQGPGKGNWGPKTSKYVSTVLARAGTAYNPPKPSGAPKPSGSGTSTPSATGGRAKATTTTTPAKGKEAPPKAGVPVVKIITGVQTIKAPKGSDKRIPQDEYGYGSIQPKLEVVALKGVDAGTFNKVYAAVESAFLKGEESASITLSPGNTMHIFIGDDPAEKIDYMRDLDDARIALRDMEAEAYKDKASAGTKAQAALVARREAAGHEMVVLTMAGDSRYETSKINPVVGAIRNLDNVKAGVAMHTRLMQEAWDRGDTTTAYLQAQFIEDLTNPKDGVGDLAHMRQLLGEAQTRIANLSAKTGQTPEQMLTGMGPAGTTLQKDIERLTNAESEIAEIADKGSEAVTEMNSYLAKDATGQVLWVTQGGKQQVLEKPNIIKLVDDDGKVKRVVVKPTVKPDGTVGIAPPDGTVLTFLKSGENIVDAYAKYSVERVGTIKMPDGSLVPMMGKKVAVNVDRNNDGVTDSTSIYFENPLAPGQWSSTPINYTAPKGSTTKYLSGSSDPIVQFPAKDGIVVTLLPDKKTGVYIVNDEKPAGMNGLSMTPGTPMAPVGPGNDPRAKEYIKGFQRDTSGMSLEDQYMGKQQVPALGFGAKEWAKTQLPGVAGSSKYGPPLPGPNYRPLGKTVNEATGFTITAEQSAAAAAKQRSAEAASLLSYREAERASLTPLARPNSGPAAGPNAAVNLRADLPAVNAATGFSIPLPKKPATTSGPAAGPNAAKPAAKPATTKYTGIPTTPAKPAAKPAAKSTSGPAAGPNAAKPAPKVITPLPKPRAGVSSSGLKGK